MINTNRKFKVEIKERPSFKELFEKYSREKNKYGIDLYGGSRKPTPIDRKLYYRLSQESYRPSKTTLIILCFLFELTFEESVELLDSCDYYFETKYWFDLIAKTYIVNRCYDLYDFDQCLKSKGIESIKENKRTIRKKYVH